MNLINPSNIDKWLFDYFEGNLSLHEKIEVENFLKENPDFQADFEAWSSANLPSHTITYRNTNSLLKNNLVNKKTILIASSLLLLITGGVYLLYLLSDFRANNIGISINGIKQTDLSITERNSLIATNLKYSSLINMREDLTINQVKNDDNNAHHNTNSAYTNNIDITIKNDNGLINDLLYKNAPAQPSTESSSVITNNINSSNLFTNSSNSYSNTINHNRSIEANGVSLSIIRSKRKSKKIHTHQSKEISKKYLINNRVKKHKDYKPITFPQKDGYAQENNQTVSSYKKYRNESFAKNITKLFNKDLALTVFNNRISLKDNLMALHANQSLAGNYSSPRVQAGHGQPFSTKRTYMSYLSVDARFGHHGIGLLANYNQNSDEQFYQSGLIYSYQFTSGGVKLRPSVSGLYTSTYGHTFPGSDPGSPVRTQNYILNGGLMVETPSFYLGFQTKNAQMFGQNIDLVKSVIGERTYSLILGTDYRKTFQQNLVISPQLYVDFYDNEKTDITFSATANFNGLLGGIGASNDKDLHATIGGQIKNFRILYHANGNWDNLKAADFKSITHEVGIQFMISKKNKGYLLYD